MPFNETLKDLRNVDALEESALAVESCTAELQDVAVSNDNDYFRWFMVIRFKRVEKGTTTRSIGVSHIRFDEDGKIVFHQDYWGSSTGLFEHFPLIGSLLRAIRADGSPRAWRGY